MVRNGEVSFGRVRCGVCDGVWSGLVWCDGVWCDVVRRSAMWYDVVWCGVL